jgi:VWA domain-containing protein
MSTSSERPALSLPRAAAASSLPWLLSTSAHTLMLILLALHWRFSPTPPGFAAPEGLSVMFVSSADGGESAGNDPLGSDSGIPQGAENQYFDDEPLVDLATEPDLRPAGEGPGALAALLNEKPAVSLTGVLPGISAEGSATGLGSGGVGSAHALTGHPGGTNRVRGGTARTGVFGAVGEGRKFVYVFDRSGSMDGHGGAPLSAAKSELVASLNDLGTTHQFQIIFYNEQPRVFNPTGTPGRLVFGTDQNKYLAQKFVGSITADGATRHEEALEMALKMAPDVIFFLTDADEPRLTAKQLARVAQLNQGTSINAIEFGYGTQSDPEDFLVKLARQNGGKHVYVDISRLPAKRR